MMPLVRLPQENLPTPQEALHQTAKPRGLPIQGNGSVKMNQRADLGDST